MNYFNDKQITKKYNDNSVRDGCKDMITWEEAREIHRKHISKKDTNYFEDIYINWYIDDYKFDNSRGIWHDYTFALSVIKHFAGIITPDFSTYQDFPFPIKINATYRMRTFGYWIGKQKINVINNVRWGTEETFDYCFEGIPKNSIVSIGTVGGGPRKLIDRARFEFGHFNGTAGTYTQINWNTSIVWKHIDITQENYGGTDLPRSFNIDTPSGKMWTHGNATKHMHEAIISLKDNPKLKDSNPKLYTQFILFDYWKALSSAVNSGIKYEKKIYSGNWEFIFSKPRKQGDNPVIKHARFKELLQ